MEADVAVAVVAGSPEEEVVEAEEFGTADVVVAEGASEPVKLARPKAMLVVVLPLPFWAGALVDGKAESRGSRAAHGLLLATGTV